jgi:hypothetical protein
VNALAAAARIRGLQAEFRAAASAPAPLTLSGRVGLALGALGVDADEVADTLRAARVRGQRVRAFACPISEWLCRLTATGRPHPPGTFAVNATTVLIYPGACQVPADALTVPPGVTEFVRAFDGPGGRPDGPYGDLAVPRVVSW